MPIFKLLSDFGDYFGGHWCAELAKFVAYWSFYSKCHLVCFKALKFYQNEVNVHKIK